MKKYYAEQCNTRTPFCVIYRSYKLLKKGQFWAILYSILIMIFRDLDRNLPAEIDRYVSHWATQYRVNNFLNLNTLVPRINWIDEGLQLNIRISIILVLLFTFILAIQRWIDEQIIGVYAAADISVLDT